MSKLAEEDFDELLQRADAVRIIRIEETGSRREIQATGPTHYQTTPSSVSGQGLPQLQALKANSYANDTRHIASKLTIMTG